MGLLEPEEAVEWVRSVTRKRATNIWAPYVMKQGDVYRLYFSVSAGKKLLLDRVGGTDSPEGPWYKGAVVKSSNDTLMNAIDQCYPRTTEARMHYGFYFAACIAWASDPNRFDKGKRRPGHLTARRANYWKDNLEAPKSSIFERKSITCLFRMITSPTTRVWHPIAGGTFYIFGKNLRIPPLFRNSGSQFANHRVGCTGHGVLARDDGRYFMVHQGRLSPGNHLMVLHVRELFFTPDGWPVASPQRFAGEERYQVGKELIPGKWELIRIAESVHERRLEAGQVLWGEGSLNEAEWNRSFMVELLEDGTAGDDGFWHFDEAKQSLTLSIGDETMEDVIVFTGHDWENQVQTVLLSGWIAMAARCGVNGE